MVTESESGISNFRTFFLTVLILSSIGMVATDIYLPSLPFIQRDLSTTKILTRLTLSFYLFSFSISQLVFGPLSDRLGRRKIAFLGLGISILGSLVCMLSLNIFSLIIGRFIQGLGLGVGPTLARSIRRDVHSGSDLARFGSSIIIGTAILFAVAPALGGYIQHYMGWRITFLFILVYTMSGILCVRFLLPETNKHLNPLATKLKIAAKNYLILLKSPVFIGYSLCSSFVFAGLSAYFTTGPFLFENIIGLSALEYGWLGLIIASGLGLGGFFNKIGFELFGRHLMLVVGTAVIFFSGILMLALALLNLVNTFAIMLPMAIFSLGAGITFTHSFVGAFDPFAKIAGFSAALFGCMQIFGGAVASSIMAVIHEENQIPLSIALIIVGISAYLFQLMAFLSSKKQKS